MKILKNILLVTISIILIALLGYALYKGIIIIFDYLNSLQKEVSAAIIAGTTTIIVSVLSIILAKYRENKDRITFEIREKKIPVYQEFITFIMKILSQNKPGGKKLTEAELTKFFMNFTERLLVWGSDDVIKYYTLYRMKIVEDSEKEGKGSVDSLFILEDLLYAIRKDTGHKNKDLQKGDILGLFINDISTHV